MASRDWSVLSSQLFLSRGTTAQSYRQCLARTDKGCNGVGRQDRADLGYYDWQAFDEPLT